MAPPFKRQIWAKRAAWTWAAVLLIACLLPSNEIPKVDVPLADKWVHFVLFGGQAFLALAALRRPTWQTIGLVVLLCILFGATVEVLQLLTNAWLHRAYEFADIVADAIGVFIGLTLFLLAQKTVFKKPSLS